MEVTDFFFDTDTEKSISSIELQKYGRFILISKYLQ